MLAPPLLLAALAGGGSLLFLLYFFYSATERYEVDFAPLLLLGALAAWLALSRVLHGRTRRLIQFGGGVLATWSCLTGLAISFTGESNLLAVEHPGTWHTLEEIGSPLTRAIALIEGRPLLAEFSSPELLEVGEQVQVLIVSPDARRVLLLAELLPIVQQSNGNLRRGGLADTLLVRDSGRVPLVARVPPSGGHVYIPLQLRPGLNHLTLDAQLPPGVADNGDEGILATVTLPARSR